MTALQFIIALFMFSFLTACRETYRLSQDEHDWMPYKGNEILVFSSNKGGTDTIVLLQKDTLIAYPEAQALNGKTYEVVAVFAKFSTGVTKGLVELEKSKDKIARIYFNLSAKDAFFYRLTGLKVDSLSQQLATTLATRSKKYNDIYIIEDEDWLNFKQRSNYVTKLYWSKSEGLIRYDKQDSVYWELTLKYSP